MLSIYYGFSLEYVVMDYKEMKYNLSDIDFSLVGTYTHKKIQITIWGCSY